MDGLLGLWHERHLDVAILSLSSNRTIHLRRHLMARGASAPGMSTHSGRVSSAEY